MAHLVLSSSSQCRVCVTHSTEITVVKTFFSTSLHVLAAHACQRRFHLIVWLRQRTDTCHAAVGHAPVVSDADDSNSFDPDRPRSD